MKLDPLRFDRFDKVDKVELLPHVCPVCGSTFKPKDKGHVYCCKLCRVRSRNQGPKYTLQQLQWLEEVSDWNMQQFFMGTPIEKLPKGVRKRRIKLQEKENQKMSGFSPIVGPWKLPQVGHIEPVCAPLQGLINIEEVRK